MRRIHVTLSDRGTLTINAKCWQDLGKPEGAYLHFSKGEYTIAVEPVGGITNAAVFPFKNNHGARYLNTAPFIRHHGIKLAGTCKFITPRIDGGILYLRLNEIVKVTRVRRWQAKDE